MLALAIVLTIESVGLVVHPNGDSQWPHRSSHASNTVDRPVCRRVKQIHICYCCYYLKISYADTNTLPLKQKSDEFCLAPKVWSNQNWSTAICLSWCWMSPRIRCPGFTKESNEYTKKKLRSSHRSYLEQILQLGTDECVASVGGIDVQPNIGIALQGDANLLQCIKRTRASCAECGWHKERHQSLLFVLFHRLWKRIIFIVKFHNQQIGMSAYLDQSAGSQAALFVRLQNAQLHKADHGRLFHTTMRLLRTIAHQFRQQVTFFDKWMLLLQMFDGLRTCGQHGHQHTFRRGCLDDVCGRWICNYSNQPTKQWMTYLNDTAALAALLQCQKIIR